MDSPWRGLRSAPCLPACVHVPTPHVCRGLPLTRCCLYCARLLTCPFLSWWGLCCDLLCCAVLPQALALTRHPYPQLSALMLPLWACLLRDALPLEARPHFGPAGQPALGEQGSLPSLCRSL